MNTRRVVARYIAPPIVVAALAGIVLLALTPVAPGGGGHPGGHAHPVPAPASPSAPGESSESAAPEAPEPEGAGSLLSAARDTGGAAERELGEPRGRVEAGDVLASTRSLGGCLSEYGDAGQCLPAIPPSQAAHVRSMIDAGQDPASMAHPWSCAELVQFFPDGIRVRAGDPQALDANDDGVACGAGDRAEVEQ